MYHIARKGGKKSSPWGCKAMLFPFSLRSSAKEQFSVPVEASQEHTAVRKPAGEASNYTPPSSMVSHTSSLTSPASMKCIPELLQTWNKQDHQVQLPLPARLLENFQTAFFLIFRHVSHGHLVCVLTDCVMHRMATNKGLHPSSLSNHHTLPLGSTSTSPLVPIPLCLLSSVHITSFLTTHTAPRYSAFWHTNSCHPYVLLFQVKVQCPPPFSCCSSSLCPPCSDHSFFGPQRQLLLLRVLLGLEAWAVTTKLGVF